MSPAAFSSSLIALSAFALVATPGLAAPARPDIKAIRAACDIASPATSRLPGFTVTTSRGEPGDLPYVEARSASSGGVVRIYHDEDLGGAARSKAACLGALLDLLRESAPDARRDLHWSAMVISAREDYVPPREKAEARWLNVLRGGRWDAASLTFLIETLPHEEVHFSQKRPGAPALPRWFQEGHAEWAGLHVTEQVRPDLAAARRAQLSKAAAAQPQAHLAKWGGTMVKPEAIDRQISPEDRARRAADPSYMPSGPMRFGPGDFYTDEIDLEARYGAALAVFERLEARHGQAAVQAWISAVLAHADDRSIADLCRDMLGEDIAPWLA